MLQGEKTGRAEVVALNAGLALHVCGAVPDVTDGLELARSILAQGTAYALFERVRAASHE
ncbi:MAG: hypothetical protein NVS1B14_05200 [Vulcanimicrobiaceae bacterium]